MKDSMFVVIGLTQVARDRMQDAFAACVPATFPDARDGGWYRAPQGAAIWMAPSAGRRDDRGATALAGGGLVAARFDDALARLHGDACDVTRMANLPGDFAVARWRGADQVLEIARDPLGQRGLFMRTAGDLAFVCSDLETLLRDPAAGCALDMEAAHHYLAFGMPPPGRTLARGIRSLPAGHCWTWRPGEPVLERRYYTPLAYDQRKVADGGWRQHIVAVLDEAIGICDGGGESAILLSGGVDSSYIATTCAARHGPDGFDAYTIDFVDADLENEAPWARLVADAAGIRHHVVSMGVGDATRALTRTLELAQPCAAWASLTHRHLLDAVGAAGHRTLLSGLGADEVFGGYSRYLEHYRVLRVAQEGWDPALGVDAFDALLWDPAASRRDLFPGVPRFFDDASQRLAFHRPFNRWSHATWQVAFYRECRRQKADAHLFEMMVAHECQHRVPDLLLAGFDPMARTDGIAMRYPFLDPSVARVACALGASERFWQSDGRWKNKKLLRRIALERLSDDVIVRPPASYNTPIRAWLRDASFGGHARERLRGSRLWDTGLVRREWLDAVEASAFAPAPTRRLDVEQFWILLTLGAWCDRWVRPAQEHA